MLKKLFGADSKKGFTLIELCVVIAITAIVVSMTMLFTTLISKRVTQSNIHNEVINGISDMETGIRRWIKHYDNSDYRIEINSGTFGDQTVLEAWDTKGDANTGNDTCASRLYLSEDGETLVCENTGDVFVKYIRLVKFSKQVSTTNGSKNMIIACDVSYYDPTLKEENKYSDTRIIFSTHSGMIINY